MKEFVHTGMVYKAFNKKIEKIELWLNTKNLFFYKAESLHVKKRLFQKIVALSVNPYVIFCSCKLEGGQSLQFNERKLCANGLYLDFDKGEVKVTSKGLAKGILEYFYEWTSVCLINIKSIFNVAPRNTKKASIVLGIPRESLEIGGSSRAFEKYCENGNVKILSTSAIKIIQTNTVIKNSKNDFNYTHRPIAELVRVADISVKDRIKLLAIQLVDPVIFLANILINPIVAIIGRDLGLFNTVRFLSQRAIIESIVITNSNHNDQFLWMRMSRNWGFESHKIHYSQNSRPMVYKQDNLSVDHPILRHIFVDVHWVWTEQYKEFLRSHGHLGLIYVVGPILFYLPENLEKEISKSKRIMVFDVTPVYSHYSKKIGIINNYYSTINMKDFLEKIVNAVNEIEKEKKIELEICLKHKRYFNKNHDGAYIELCNNLEKEKKIKLINYDRNLFEIMNESMMVVSIPYTSTAYVASFLGLPSLYFDPSADLNHTYEKANGLEMVESKEELKKWIEGCLSF